MSIPIVWGTRLMGKVDAVPDVGHVATRFFYVQYLPVLPLETYLVFREVGDQIDGVRIPLSPKSIFIAWLRAGFLVAAGGLLIAGFVQMSDRHSREAAICLGTALLAMAAFVYSYYFGPICRANYNRAMHLAQHANLAPECFLALEIAYGRMNADQAEHELARILDDAQKMAERDLAQQERAAASSENAAF